VAAIEQRRGQLRDGLRLVEFFVSFLMPSRIQLIVLALGAAMLTGCATSSTTRATGTSASLGRSSAEEADYSSAAAIKARTESHAHYAAAVLHEQNDEPELALQEYYQAALADPANESLVLEASGRMLRFRPGEKPDENSAEMREKAIELLKKAAAHSRSGGAIYARLGLAYSMTGQKDLAMEANRKAIRKMPASLSGYQYLAQIYLQSGQTEEGLKVLDEAAKQPGTDAAFLIDLAETYVVFGRAGSMETVRARALDALKRAAAMQPTNLVHLQRLADGFSVLGETDRAAECYLKLVEKLPNVTPIRDRLVELYLRKQDRTNAALHLRAVIRESPANPQTHYLLGSLLFEDKNPKEAAECFRKTTLLSPNFEPAYYDLAAAQMNSEQPREALETLARARGKFQQTFLGEYYTGLAYGGLKDFTNAFKHLTSAEIIARATATNRPTLLRDFYFQFGRICEQGQRFKEAETYFRKTLELSPDFAVALNYLGYMWADRGENLEEARVMIEKAVKLEPKNGAYLDSLGWVLFKLGQPAEALTWILKAIEHNEEQDATLYDHLGDIHAALNQPDKAREAWRKSLAIDPNEKVEKKLKAPGAVP
jgi:tetratricopeptide (TPR) repeat protein